LIVKKLKINGQKLQEYQLKKEKKDVIKKLEQMMIAAKNAASNKNQQEDVEMSENDD